MQTPITIVNPVMGVWPKDAPDKQEEITMKFVSGDGLVLLKVDLGWVCWLVGWPGLVGFGWLVGFAKGGLVLVGWLVGFVLARVG